MTLMLPPGPGLTLSWIRCSASISRRRSSAKAGRARVAPQPFQPRAVGAFDAHAGVEREAAPVFPVCHRLGVLRLKHPAAGQRAQQTPADPGLHFRCIERGQNHARESRIRDTSGTRVRHGLGRVRPAIAGEFEPGGEMHLHGAIVHGAFGPATAIDGRANRRTGGRHRETGRAVERPQLSRFPAGVAAAWRLHPARLSDCLEKLGRGPRRGAPAESAAAGTGR